MQDSQSALAQSETLENSFRQFTGYGKTTLPVLYKGNVYQMCRVEGDFVFVRIDGYEGNEIDVISGQIDRFSSYVKGRKHFSVPGSSVAGAEISGQYAGYFVLSGVKVRLRVKRGRREKNMTLGVFGNINEFVLRQFLEGIGGEIAVTKDKSSAQAQAHTGIMLHFNRKCKRLNRLMIFVAGMASIFLVMDKFTPLPYNKLFTGAGALLPLVNYFIYLRFPRLISFIAPDTPKNPASVTRRYAGFYSKFGIPMVIGMFIAFGGESIVTQVGRLFLYGLGLGMALILLMVVFTRDHRYKYMTIIGAAVMMLAYPFQTIHLVNRMTATHNYETYTATVEKKYVDADSMATYIGITMLDGSNQELPLGFSQKSSVKPGKSTVTVHEYRGLLGIKCADVTLND